MSFVLDASVALAWCFADEQTPATRATLVRAAVAGVEVPAIWHLEVLNALLVAERRGRIDSRGRRERLMLLQGLQITVDTVTGLQAWTATRDLSEQFRLTAYDAAYLELALRRGLPLASLDERLRVAADAHGVLCLGR